LNVSQIKIVGTFLEAREFIKDYDTQFIFAQDFIDEDNCEDFLIEHIEFKPDRSNLLFFIQATDRRHALISQYEEKYVDNIFYNPITIVDLTNTILEILKNKIKLQKDDFYKSYWKLQADLKNEKFKKLIELIPKFRIDYSDNLDAIYIEGLFYETQGLKNEAIDRFVEVLEMDPHHILSLKHLFDIYSSKEDFINTAKVGKLIINEYTIHPSRIKSLIISLIMTKDFESIINISKKYLSEDMEDTRLERTIAASLAIAGKSGYLRASLDQFRELTQVCLKHARNNFNIGYICLNNLIDMGDLDMVKQYLARFPDSESESLFKVIKYRLDEKEENTEVVFIKGAELTNDGIHEFYIYDIWLKSAIKAKKKPSMIEDILDQAIKHHPIRKNHFNKVKLKVLSK
jgi:tetratricopeptide (TPR) repeat protein